MKNGAKASTQLRFVAIALFYYFSAMSATITYIFKTTQSQKSLARTQFFYFFFLWKKEKTFLADLNRENPNMA